MFDTMTITKAAGALIGALLFLLLAGWAASAIYQVGAGESHAAEGEEGHPAQAYTIPVPESSEGGDAAAEEQIDFAPLMAQADVAAGEKTYAKCASCHKLDGTDGVGPHLNGVVGRAVASVGGFGYSDGMVAHGGDWTHDALQAFLASPKTVVKGTKMSFGGIKDPQDRADLIAYLESAQ